MFWLNTKGLVTNRKSPGGLKIDPSRKLGQQKLPETDIAESDFLVKLSGHTYFTLFFSVSISVKFEQVNSDWE